MLNIKENISLKEYTTFKIGGRAQYFTVVKNIIELDEVADFIFEKKIPYFVLGGGSNILLSDIVFEGLVIKNEIYGREIIKEEIGILLRVGSGEIWDEVVKYSLDCNLGGLENLSSIPGTVGGMVTQNAGAYGVEIKDALVLVEAYDLEIRQIEIFSNKECNFSYRSSFFQNLSNKKYIITSATFLLKNKSEVNSNYKDLKDYFLEKNIIEPDSKMVREAIVNIRSKKMPDLNTVGCAGSFFRNLSITTDKFTELKALYPDLLGYPEPTGKIKVPLAWILDHILNLNGYREGNVGLHKNQPLILVNYGSATCDEVIKFAEKIKKIINEKIGIEIEYEVEKK